jgi:hypothetical protein
VSAITSGTVVAPRPRQPRARFPFAANAGSFSGMSTITAILEADAMARCTCRCPRMRRAEN